MPNSSHTSPDGTHRVLTPYAAHVFLFDQKTGTLFASQPGRMGEPDFRQEREKEKLKQKESGVSREPNGSDEAEAFYAGSSRSVAPILSKYLTTLNSALQDAIYSPQLLT